MGEIRTQHQKFMAALEREIDRVGCGLDDLGPAASIAVSSHFERDDISVGSVRLYDDQAGVVTDIEDALYRLRQLDDSAGYEAFWNEFSDLRDLNKGDLDE